MFSSAVIFLALQSSKKQTNEIINEMILSNIQSNKDFIADAILAHDYWSLFKFLKSSSKNSIIKSAGITDKNFIVLADTNTKKHRLGTILDDKKNHTIIPFRKDGVLLGYFILNIQKNSIKKILEKNFSNNFLLLMLAALLSFFIAIYFMKNLLDRLKILVENAKAVSLKKWDDIKEVDSVENDEITDLIKTITVIMKEIKTSVKNEEELKNFYHKILSSVDIFIVICDKDLNIMYQNNHELKEHIVNDNNQFKNKFIKNLINCYTNSSCKLCKQKISNEFDKDISLLYQINFVNEYLVASFSDITQFAKMEENEKITHSLKTLGEISSLFAHEIKNLLQPLKLLLFDEDTIDKEDMKVVNNTLDRMDAQVADFLSLGKPLDIKEIKSLFVKESVDEIYQMLKPKFKKKNVKFIGNIDINLKIYINESSLEMILVNLLTNSLEAIDNNGFIEVSWQKSEHDMSLLTVKDNGCGINDSIRENIFKPFFTTKEHGSGLGLFTIYKMVYLLGGNMTLLESENTTFEIYLPTKRMEN
jgi:nitrogen-specific signal transduction histidine kinase